MRGFGSATIEAPLQAREQLGLPDPTHSEKVEQIPARCDQILGLCIVLAAIQKTPAARANSVVERFLLRYAIGEDFLCGRQLGRWRKKPVKFIGRH